MPIPELPIKQLFVLLFMMTGPLKVVPTFAAVTGRLSAEDRNRLALKAVLIASIALLLTIFVGHGIMSSWGASPQAVGAAAGLLLSISALQAIHGKHAPAGGDVVPEPNLAMSPLAFPTLVPPYAVGVLILFAAHFNKTGDLVTMAGLSLGMMAANLVAMRFADAILRVLRPAALQVLGSVFGVLQLSLGIEFLFFALK